MVSGSSALVHRYPELKVEVDEKASGWSVLVFLGILGAVLAGCILSGMSEIFVVVLIGTFTIGLVPISIFMGVYWLLDRPPRFNRKPRPAPRP